MSDYSTWDAFDLLEALELAGRLPEPALIQACLAQPAEVTPGLLDMLSRGTLAHWEADDPRWYRDVHAGLLLIAFREEAALPVFEAVLRDPEREELVREWFEAWLPEYGAKLVPVLLHVAADDGVYPAGRTTALRLLSVVGERHPEERERILAAARALLPPLRDDGTPDVDAPTDDDTALWSWAVGLLADLRDRPSEPHILALFDAGLLDEEVTGAADEYRADVADELPPPEPAPALNLVEFYETLDQWDHLSDADLVDTLHETLLKAGADPAMAEELKREMLSVLATALDDDEEDPAAAMLQRLADQLRASGVPEAEIQNTLEGMMGQLYDAEDAGDLDAGGADDADWESYGEEGEEEAEDAAWAPQGTFVRETPKLGRNDQVTIRSPETGETQTLKYKHAQKKLDEGWEIV